MGCLFVVFFVVIVIVAVSIVGVVSATSKKNHVGGDMREWSQGYALQKFNPGQNRFQLGRESSIIQAQQNNLTGIQGVVTAMSGVTLAEREAILAHYHKQDALTSYELMREREDAGHSVFMSQANNQIAVFDTAAEWGLSPTDYALIKMEEAKYKAIMEMEAYRQNLEVEKDSRLKANEVELQRQTNRLAAELADKANTVPESRRLLISGVLSDVNMQLQNVKAMPEGDFKKAEMKRLKNDIKHLEQELS